MNNTRIIIDSREAEVTTNSALTAEFLQINTDAVRVAEKVVNILDLVHQGHDLLKTPTVFFDFDHPPVFPNMLALQLFEAMHARNGLGLSANQVGLPWRVFVAGTREQKQIFFNPQVLEVAPREQWVSESEGCLTYPMLYLKVERPSWCKIRSQNGKGVWAEHFFHGLTARIILHEMDHMDGILFTSKVSKLQLQIARDKQKKLLKAKERSDKRVALAQKQVPTGISISTPQGPTIQIGEHDESTSEVPQVSESNSILTINTDSTDETVAVRGSLDVAEGEGTTIRSVKRV